MKVKSLCCVMATLLLVSVVFAVDYKIGVGTLDISEKAKQYVMQVLNSNRLSYGPFLKRFESMFSTLHGARFGVTSNSGTSSLQVALQALKEIHNWSDGDEVIVPAVTFVATSNIVIHNRMKPVFIDVDRNYYEMDPALIEAKITPRTRAIVVVHLFGQPADMDPIIAIAKKYHLKIIEDSCETMFASYRGRMVGTLGDIGCFSMYIAHLITTGVGGISITNDPLYAVKMRSLVNHGRNNIYISIDDDDNVDSGKMHEIIKKRFSFVGIGHSFRITEVEGALGVAQLEGWQDMIKKRRGNAQFLLQALAPLADKIQLPQVRERCEHSFMMFPLVLKNGRKEDIVNFLEDRGIETRDMLPLINQPIYENAYGLNPKDYPVADWINKNGFYVGCHQGLSAQDLNYIASTLISYFDGTFTPVDRSTLQIKRCLPKKRTIIASI